MSFTVLRSVSALSVSLNESNRIGLTWNASTGASVYKLAYKSSSASTFLTLSSTILDTSYIVTGLSAATTYTFKYLLKPYAPLTLFRVYAGNGIAFEDTGATIEAATGTTTVSCSSSMCKNNASVVALGGSCICVCNSNACGILAVNADCSCEQCIATNGTTIDGPCDDGDSCTSGETCSHGVCGGGEQICSANPCDGIVCDPQECFNVTCIVDSQTNSPVCQSTALSDDSPCSTGICKQNQCVDNEGKKIEIWNFL